MGLEKNKRAAVGGDLIGTVGKFALFLVFLVVILVFILAFMPVAIGKGSATQCKWSLDMVAAANKQISDVEAQAHEFVSNQARNVYLTGTAMIAAGVVAAPFTGGVSLGLSVAGFGVLSLTYITDRSIQTFIDKSADMIRIKTDTCIKGGTPVTCKGDATYVGKCIYKYASTTWYALRGGLGGAKTNFNLFKIEVEITKPGTLEMYGGCSEYIRGDWVNDATKKNMDVSWQSFNTKPTYLKGYADTQGIISGNSCNITTSIVDERVMTLAMLQECQAKGIYNNDCKCYIKENMGYTIDNGIPNIYVKGDSKTDALIKTFSGDSLNADGGTRMTWASQGPVYDPTDDVVYSHGCGNYWTVGGSADIYAPKAEDGFEGMDAHGMSMIAWGSNWVNWEEGKQTLYTRIHNDGKRVCISADPTDTSTCT